MMGNMMEQLQQMKQKVEESKNKLNSITVEGIAANGKVKVIVNGNRVVKSIHLDDSLMQSDKEELEDLLIIAINHGIEQAHQINESEMQNAALGILPNIK